MAALVEHEGIASDGPGCGVLVVTPKGIRLKKGFGLADLKAKTPVATATTFEFASVTKQMTGAAVPFHE